MNIREIMDKLKAIEEADETETSSSNVAYASKHADDPGEYPTTKLRKFGIDSSEKTTKPEFGLAQLRQRPATFTGTTSDDNPDLRLQRGRREIGLAKQIVPGLDLKAGISRAQVGDRQRGAHVGVSGENWSAYAHQPFKGERPTSFNLQYNKRF